MAETPAERRAHARAIREEAIDIAEDENLPLHESNDDENSQRDFVAAFSKGLPHNSFGLSRPGEVDPGAYKKLLDAVQSLVETKVLGLSAGVCRR